MITRVQTALWGILLLTWVFFPKSHFANAALQDPATGECQHTEALLGLPTAPVDMIQGGGVLLPGSTQEPQTITPDDAGDRWIFAVFAPGEAVNIEIDTDVPLLARVFRGIDLLLQQELVQGVTTVAAPTPATGYYTLVITRADIANQNMVGSYIVSLGEQAAAGIDPTQPVSGTLAAGQPLTYIFFNDPTDARSSIVLNLQSDAGVSLTLFTANGEAIAPQTGADGRPIYTLEGKGYYAVALTGEGAYTFQPQPVQQIGQGNAVLSTYYVPTWTGGNANPTALNAVNGILEFSPDRNGALRLRLPVDSVHEITVDSQLVLSFMNRDYVTGMGRLSFALSSVQDLSLLDGDLSIARGDGRYFNFHGYSWAQNYTDEYGFQRINFADRALNAIDWDWFGRVVMLPRCLGIALQTQDGSQLGTFVAEGTQFSLATTGQTGDGAPVLSFTARSAVYTYTYSVEWFDIRRIYALNGIVDIETMQGRSLRLDRVSFELSRVEGLFSIFDNNGIPLIRTDWANLSRVEVSSGVTLVIFQDSRGTIQYDRGLYTMEARQSTVRLVWQDGAQTLVLPESADFLQIETPQQVAAYNPLVGPREIGFVPTNLNNTGRECALVNTEFDFNCPAPGNPANGNATITVVDLLARGYRLDLALSRTYNSRNAVLDGPFGYGWSSEYALDFDVAYNDELGVRPVDSTYTVGLDIAEAPLGRVLLTTASGSQHVFDRQAVGSWLSRTLPGWQIQRRVDGLLDPWHVLRPDGVVYEFDLVGRLRGMRHVQGGQQVITREQGSLNRADDPPSVYVVRDDVGRSLRLTFDHNMHITRGELFDVDGVSLAWTEYSYDDAGYLVQVRGSDGRVGQYNYLNGRLTHYDDAAASTAAELYFVYDSQNRVCAIDDQIIDTCPDDIQENVYRQYFYSIGEETLTTTVVDEWGRESNWTYSLADNPVDAFRLISTGNEGTAAEYQYGEVSGFEAPSVRQISRDEFFYTFTWDDHLLERLSSDRWLNFSSGYESVTVDISGDGIPDPGHTMPLLANYRASTTSNWAYDYDDAGRLVTAEGNGLQTRIDSRDERFFLPTQISLIDVASSTLLQQPIVLTYDPYGFVQTRVDERGTHTFGWDAFGRLTLYSLDDAEGRNLALYTITYTNDTEAGLTCQVVSAALETQMTTCFDLRGRLISRTVTMPESPLQQVFYTYDSFDRLVEVRQVVDDAGAEVTRRYEYTVVGGGHWRLSETLLPIGLTTYTEYDEADRVVATVDELGGETRYRYEDIQESLYRVRVTDPQGVESVYSYNRIGQVCSLDYGDFSWNFTYVAPNCAQNSSSVLTQVSTSNQGLTVRYSGFDAVGRPTQVAYSISRPVDDDPSGEETEVVQVVMEYAYDALGRLQHVVNTTTGESTILTYEGNTLTVEKWNGDLTQTVSYTYDGLGRLTQVSSDEGTVTYTYNQGPLLEVIVTFSGGTTNGWRLYYDLQGNLREWVDESGVRRRYDYDQLGRLIQTAVINDDGEVLKVLARYTYNEMDQVTTIINEGGQTYRFVYNRYGQLATTRTFEDVVTSYLYDQYGNLKTIVDALGNATTYEFDEYGRLTAVNDSIGRQIVFDWSDILNGRLRYSDGSSSTDYYFDMLGRLWQIQDAEQRQHLLNYHPSGYLAELTTQFADVPVTLDFAYGIGANLTQFSAPDVQTEAGESWQWIFVYDNLDQLVTRRDPNGNWVGFDFDREGRLLIFHVPEPDGEGSAMIRSYHYEDNTITVQTEGDPEVRRLVYDDEFRIIEEVVTQGENTYTSTYTYEPGRIIFTDPDGFQTIYTFAESVNQRSPYLVVEQFSPDGASIGVRQYRLTPRGELWLVTDTDYINEDDGGGGVLEYQRQEELRYDAVGRPIRWIDSNNNVYVYTYNARGQLINFQYPDGSLYRYEYDDLGRLVGLETPAGQSLSVRYTAGAETVLLNSRPLEVYSYDPLGRLQSRAFAGYPDGVGEIHFAYDAAGNPVMWSVDGDTILEIDRSNDAFNRVVCVHDRLVNQSVRYDYDSRGRISAAGVGEYASDCIRSGVLSASVSYTYTYDGMDRLQTTGWGADTVLVYGYTYDPESATYTVDIAYPDGQRFAFVLDDRQELRQIIASTQTIDLSYDVLELPNNHLELRVSWGGRYVSLLELNALRQIVRLEYQDENLSDPQIFQPGIFDYSVNYLGLPLAVTETQHNVLMGYDTVYRPLSTAWLFKPLRQSEQVFRDRNDYAFTLSYDAAGNRVREVQQASDGVQIEIRYDYSAGNLLRSREIIEGASPAPTSRLWWFAGAFVVVGIAVRKSRQARVMGMSLLLMVGLLGAGGLQRQIQDIEYRYDDLGNLAEISVSTEIPQVTTLTYDAYGRVRQITYPDASSSRFEYDAFGRLAVHTTPEERVEYRYDGDRLTNIARDGQIALVVSYLEDQYLLVTEGADQNRWLLYDNQGILRRTFVNSHTDTSYRTSQFDILGNLILAVNPSASYDGLPLEMPIFRSMIYDSAAQVYISLTGRVYDPTSGRYFQRDTHGPDATGNLYGYTTHTSAPPIAHRSDYPYADGFRVLADTAGLTQTIYASDIIAQSLPNPYRGWEHDSLRQLRLLNESLVQPFGDFEVLPSWISTAYNPAGVVATAGGHFQMVDHAAGALVPDSRPGSASAQVPDPSALPVVRLDTLLLTVDALTTEPHAPSWYDADLWRESPFWQATPPQPTRGNPAPTRLEAHLPYPLQDVTMYNWLFNALESPPTESADEWLGQVEATILPTYPVIPYTDAQGWLNNWFSDNTLPVWDDLEALYALPSAPTAIPDLLNTNPVR